MSNLLVTTNRLWQIHMGLRLAGENEGMGMNAYSIVRRMGQLNAKGENDRLDTDWLDRTTVGKEPKARLIHPFVRAELQQITGLDTMDINQLRSAVTEKQLKAAYFATPVDVDDEGAGEEKSG